MAAHDEPRTGDDLGEQPSDADLARLLGAASDPAFDPGAAQRIADGAWERAAAAHRPARGRILPFPRALVAVAAAVLVAVGLLAIRGTDSAFAVQGDPVRVRSGDEWKPVSQVREGQLVHVPAGNRTLVGEDGSRVLPQPGAVLRVLRGTGALSFRVEVIRGSVEATGERIVVAADAMEAHRDLGAASFSARIDMGAPLLTLDTVGEIVPGADAQPRIAAMLGSALVMLKGGDERMRLRRDQTATIIRMAGGPGRPIRLALDEDFSEQTWTTTLTSVMSGDEVVDAHPLHGGGTSLVLQGPSSFLTAIRLPSGTDRAALNQLNHIQFVMTSRASSSRTLGWTTPDARIQMEFETLGVRVSPGEYVLEQDGVRTAILQRADGTVRLEHEGETREFTCLDDLRREAPAAADRFGDRLPQYRQYRDR